MSEFERINTEGFTVESLAIRGETLGASYGSGYGEGVVIGDRAGLRTWKMKVAALPDTDDYLLAPGEFGLQTRWAYLWDFFERHNVANWHKVFRLRDPKTGRDYFADIAEEQLDYQLFCLTVAAVGLTLRQRRVYGAESPGDPAAVENPAEI
jgi:hypothetical protein